MGRVRSGSRYADNRTRRYADDRDRRYAGGRDRRRAGAGMGAGARREGCVPAAFWALTAVLFFFSLSVVLVLNFRPLYYLDIPLLHLEKASGLTAAGIRENYDVLIRYNQFWYTGELSFPDFAMSEGGRIHFREVRRIFVALQYVCLVTGVLTAARLFRARTRGLAFLKAAGWTLLLLPAAAAAAVAAGWETFFVRFHELVFSNDYWLFDPATDPVIEILPDTFFLQCAVLILVLCAIAGIACLRTGRTQKRK